MSLSDHVGIGMMSGLKSNFWPRMTSTVATRVPIVHSGVNLQGFDCKAITLLRDLASQLDKLDDRHLPPVLQPAPLLPEYPQRDSEEGEIHFGYRPSRRLYTVPWMDTGYIITLSWSSRSSTPYLWKVPLVPHDAAPQRSINRLWTI